MTLKTRTAALAAVISLAAASAGWAIDRIQMSNKDTKPIQGTINSITPLEVAIETNGIEKKVPVNEIAYILFEDEPDKLFDAHKALGEGDYLTALEDLEKIQEKEIKKPLIGHEIEYLKAMCEARLAMGGSLAAGEGENPVQAASQRMIKFVKANASSHHYYEANELIGDLLVAGGDFAAAEPYYKALRQAPWADYKMRSDIAMGRALMAQNKTAQAEKAFDSVLAAEAPDDLAKQQQLSAKLGKARCTAAAGKADQAIKTIEETIANAGSDNVELLGQAYNALGSAYRKANKPNEAKLAFLHTDLLYSGSPETHAEALANLAAVFDELHKPVNANGCRATLKERYGASRWAQQQR
jgi:hypothetical protein